MRRGHSTDFTDIRRDWLWSLLAVGQWPKAGPCGGSSAGVLAVSSRPDSLDFNIGYASRNPNGLVIRVRPTHVIHLFCKWEVTRPRATRYVRADTSHAERIASVAAATTVDRAPSVCAPGDRAATTTTAVGHAMYAQNENRSTRTLAWGIGAFGNIVTYPSRSC